jgi:uncharacterized membrane protein YdjX (TVP38/TMEM64 family)
MDQAGTGSALAAGARRWLPLGLLLAAALGVYVSGVHRYLTIHALAAHRERLLAEVDALGPLAPGAFILCYAAVAALSIPGALFLTLTGGFLFGTLLGTLYNLIGATLGATAVFLIARTAFGEVLQRRAGPFLKKVEAGFREDAVSYLLVLRLVPLFPFWLVNLVPALFGIPLGAYVACTFFGMMPGALVYSSVGAGLGDLLDRGEKPNFRMIFEPHVLLPLLALGVLALLPVAYKRWKRTT